MKQLTDTDIEQMGRGEFIPDAHHVRNSVRRNLHLATRMPAAIAPVPERVVLDLHQHTVEMAWERIMAAATSGARRATIITGASGVLKQLFPTWANDSILSPHIISFKPINNGSFDVQFRRRRNKK